MKLPDYTLSEVPGRIIRSQPGAATIILIWSLTIGAIHIVLMTFPRNELREVTNKWAADAQATKHTNIMKYQVTSDNPAFK